MFSSNRILTLNVGASKIVLAEFAVAAGKTPTLLNYGIGELGVSPDSESTSLAFMIAALKDIMSGHKIKPAPLLLSISGQLVFPRFVKLPPVTKDKMLQMIRYEAEQNVPFPIDELVWDYQLIGDASEGEQNAMIVAAKNENVSEVMAAVMSAGLEPILIDVAPMALYNCVRFNYPEADECSLIVDIGARSTNLVFMEEGRFFSRCIPVAGNIITQDIAKSFQIEFRAAEALKRQCAFVALGGVFAAASDEQTDRVSKIVRNVVTRLHAEISRSINFYRSQQGGSIPTRLFLTGGSSVMPYMDTFFNDKLRAQTEHINPFQNVALDSNLDVEQVGRDAFVLCEVVGLALRHALTCPIEISLLPESQERRQRFKRRIPYFGLAAAGLIFAAGVWTVYTRQTLNLFDRQQQEVSRQLEVLQKEKQVLQMAQRKFQAAEAAANDLRLQIEGRTRAVRVFDALRESLDPRMGMWLTAVDCAGEPSGGMAKIVITGCGWVDKMRELEAGDTSENSEGNRKTAVELLCDQLKQRRIFEAKSIKILSEREEADGAIRSFVIEAALAPMA